MDIPDLEARIMEILTNRLGMNASDIRMNSRLTDELGMDSLDAVELAIATERQFGISISDEDVAKLVTVADIAGLVHRLTQEQRGSA